MNNMAQEKLLSQSRRNLSKAQIAARQEAEDLIVTNATKPKANEIIKSIKPMLKLFNQLKKMNEHFTEADSIALNTLAYNMYLKHMNEQHLTTLHIIDDDYERFMIRIEKLNKQINESMKQLCIPLNSRLSLANDMAKVMIEEKKLEQMEKDSQPKEMNPALKILAEIEQWDANNSW
jgi:PHD/YefM family antitoxin component YafN of YafNO toxin-antitoxin module